MVPACSFADLPQDILIRIFKSLTDLSHLCAASEVCVTWNSAALSPECWRDVIAIDVATRYRISFRNNPAITFSPRETNPHQHDETFCPECSRAVPAKVVQKRRYKRKRIACPHDVGVKRAVEVITRRSANRLRSLDLRLCFPFHYLHWYQLQNTDLQLIAFRCGSSLRQFVTSPSIRVSSSAFVAMARFCTRLVKLHMSDCQNLVLSDLRSIVQSCPQLEDLSVSRCPRFRGTTLFEVLSPVRETLRCIDISFTPTELLDINYALSFPNIESIVADHCSSLRGLLPPMLDPDNPSQVISHTLKTFRINDTRFGADIFLPLFQRCPRLQCVAANYVPSPTWSPLHLAFQRTVPPLRTLCVATVEVSDEIWTEIYKHLRNTLEFCDVSGNHRLALDVPYHEGDFDKLKGIYVRNCAINDSTLAYFLLHAPNVTIIDASGCRNVSSRKFRRDPLFFRPFLRSIVEGLDADLLAL